MHEKKPGEGKFRGLSAAQTSRLMRMANDSLSRPASRLIERIEMADGKDWFLRMLQDGPLARHGPALDTVLGGQASLEQLRELKGSSKRLFKRRLDPHDRLYGMAGYFLSVAAAWLHHGVIICSRSQAELADILLELATAAPPPWDSFLGAAAIRDTE
jgi:hypothetical protein